MNLTSAVFLSKWAQITPPPPHHHENSVYHVQVVIKDNETVTAPYTVLLHWIRNLDTYIGPKPF